MADSAGVQKRRIERVYCERRSPATRVQATQVLLRAQCWAHWAALWVWGITVSELAMKLTNPLEYCSVFTAAPKTHTNGHYILQMSKQGRGAQA